MNNSCDHFKKDYRKAVLVARDIGTGDLANCWEWTCEECGQPYLEKVKDPIVLS